MTNSKALNRFVKQVFLAAERQEEKKAAKEALKKQVRKVKRLAGSKSVKKEDLKVSIKELESRLNRVIEKEGDLVAAAEKDHRTSEEIKGRIKELENDVMKVGANDIKMIDMLKHQIKGLEQELRITETQRAEEINQSKIKLEQLKQTIYELKEKIGKAIELRTERERKFAEIEGKIKREARENREDIDQIEHNLANLRAREEEKKIGFFARLKARFHKKPKIEEFLKPEEKELFEKEIPKPKIRPILRPRPVVRHEMVFEEVEAKPGIPKKDEKPILPPPLKAPLLSPPKDGFFDKIKNWFKKR